MRLSVIIPTLNESAHLAATLESVLAHLPPDAEVLVCDGGSTDTTADIAARYPVRLIHAPTRGRAAQMNFAAAQAQGELLFFLHADCHPPAQYANKITAAVRNGKTAGCFRYRFDSPRLLLRAQAWCIRFPGILFRGGDQTLFITRELFTRIGGFNETYVVMEDYDIIRRIRRIGSFAILPDLAVVSARKYQHNSWLAVNFANAVAMTMFLSGRFSPNHIRVTYHRLIRHR